ncbi:MAG TPA: tryptophan-rich sensory protein [bacterium]|nr:tryptophan-rich sensory protein [bacterium]
MSLFHKKRKISDLLVFIIAIIIPQMAGFLGSLYTTPNIKTWYAFVNKPSFNPPNWIFGPVWTILFILMGVASYIIYKEKNKLRIEALKIYTSQLILNTMWSIIFFGARNPLGAFILIIALWILIAYNMLYFYKIKKIAGYLFIPYLLWVSFAMVLNFAIYILN